MLEGAPIAWDRTGHPTSHHDCAAFDLASRFLVVRS
jgi:hypothetical protein